MLGFLFRGIFLLLVLALAAAAAAAWWALRPLPLAEDRIDFSIPPGTSVRGIATELQRSGVELNSDAFVAMARLSGLDRGIKAGSYEVTPSDNAWGLLQRLAQGDVQYSRITFIEGWTYQRLRHEIARHPDIRQTLDGVSDTDLLDRLGASVDHPEGLFFPDTYSFARGSSDYDILRRAYVAQQQQLARAWEQRDTEVPWESPYQMLIMASIIEKETGYEPDRARISGVFANRLRIDMPLQTDPTVIYGMGDDYTGRLLRRHLRIDHPWNTYTRPGLPPTPIANPGRDAMAAAANPETHRYLYFVSRGDGTSAFARSLNEHNRNVNQYIRGRSQ